MARWKARVDFLFLLTVIELLFLSLTVDELQGKNVSKLSAFWRGGSVLAKISRGRGRPWGIFLFLQN